MSLFNTNVMHISLFVTFLMIVYLYIAGAYFICLHNPQVKYIIKQNPRLIHHFLKKKSVALGFRVRVMLHSFFSTAVKNGDIS